MHLIVSLQTVVDSLRYSTSFKKKKKKKKLIGKQSHRTFGSRGGRMAGATGGGSSRGKSAMDHWESISAFQFH